LFIGTAVSRSQQQWNLQNETALGYLLTGENLPQTYLGRWWHFRRGSAQHSTGPNHLS
jgi:hypothetical protein